MTQTLDETWVPLPRVLVPFDFRVSSVRVLRRAVELAARRRPSEVHVLCSLPGKASNSPWITRQVGAHIRAAIHACGGRRPRVVTHYRSGHLDDTLPRLATQVDATLVIVPRRTLLGSAGHALRRALGASDSILMVS